MHTEYHEAVLQKSKDQLDQCFIETLGLFIGKCTCCFSEANEVVKKFQIKLDLHFLVHAVGLSQALPTTTRNRSAFWTIPLLPGEGGM